MNRLMATVTLPPRFYRALARAPTKNTNKPGLAPRRAGRALVTRLAALLPFILALTLAAPAAAQSRQIVTRNANLQATGAANGVDFRGNFTLSVFTILLPSIGADSSGVSVITSANNQGVLRFTNGDRSVAGRIGSSLFNENAGLRTFKTPSASDRLINRIRIGSQSLGGSLKVTFNGGIGAGQLNISPGSASEARDSRVANLNGTGTADIFYAMNVQQSPGNGWGVLNFTSTTSGQNPAVNLRGNIGRATNKLKTLKINRGADNGARTFRILGDIYTTDAIALNNNTLVLGNDTNTATGAAIPIFGAPPTGTQTAKIVSAPITTTSDFGGVLRIRDFDYSFQGMIGELDRSLGAPFSSRKRLNTVRIDNATATFGANINANTVMVKPKATLALSADVEISNTLTLENDATHGATLALGTHTLEQTGGNINFRNTTANDLTETSPNRHTLSLTADGGSTAAGFLSDLYGINLLRGAGSRAGSHLTIDVTIANPDSFPKLSTKRYPILSSYTVSRALSNKRINVIGKSEAFSYGLAMATAADKLSPELYPPYTLMLTVTDISWHRQRVTTTARGQKLKLKGKDNGIEFLLGPFKAEGSVAIGNNEDIGARDGVSVPVSTANRNSGGLIFSGTSRVKGRVGAAMSDNGRTFRTGFFSRRLRFVEIGDAGSTNAEVTFERGVHVGELKFRVTDNAVARLNGSGANGLHRIDSATNDRNGRGRLIFGNAAGAANAANLLVGIGGGGSIGTPTSKLHSLSIAAPAAVNAPRIVRIRGNVYARAIDLNGGNRLVLGNELDGRIPFVDTFNPGYTIDAPITGAAGAGELIIGDFGFDLRRPIGAAGANNNLRSVLVRNNAQAMFRQNIYATTTTLEAATLTAGADLSISGALALRQLTSGSGATATVRPSTLAVNGNTLRVNGALTFSDATSANPHQLLVTVGQDAAGKSISGELNAAAAGAAITLGANVNLRIDVQVDPEAAGFIASGDTFTIARSNVAFGALPAGLTVRSSITPISFAVTRGADNKTLVLTASVTRSPQKITDTSTPPINLTSAGADSGVIFAASSDKTLKIVDARPSIGALAGFSVLTNGGATPRGRIDFDANVDMTVTGRIGGRLDQAAGLTARVFKPNPSNQLNALNLNTARAVTFNGGIGAKQLNLAAAGATARLNGDDFYKVDVRAVYGTGETPAAAGRGTLRFGNTVNQDSLYFWGNIGTPTNKLASLSIDSDRTSSFRSVRFLGNIYAERIALNNESLRLGNTGSAGAKIFPTLDASASYTIDAPIIDAGGRAIFFIDESNYNLTQAVGEPSDKLFNFIINNASVTLGGNVYSFAVNIRGATLKANTNTLGIFGPLVLIQGTFDGVTRSSTLDLGVNTVTVDGGIDFRSATAANPHKLLLSITGASAATAQWGRLDNTVATVTLPADPSHLNIEVTIAEGMSSGQFAIVKSNTALAANAANIPVKCTSGFTCTLTLAARTSGGASLANRDLVLNVTRTANPLLIDDDSSANTPNDTNGQTHGVRFRASSEKTLTTSTAFANIGDVDGVSVTTNGNASPRGSIVFGASGTVSGRIGGVLTDSAGTAFATSPSNLLNRLNLNSANTTLTFNGGIGASQLAFAANATARLNGGGASGYHRIGNVTGSASGRGTLRFGNAVGVANAANVLGNIGTSASKLQSLRIDSDITGSLRRVNIQGDIYANGIALAGGNTLTLGGLGTSDRSTDYIVDAPITVSRPASGIINLLRIKGSSFDLKRPIGGSVRLNVLSISDNASAKFGGNINAETVNVSANSELVVNAANLAISDRLVLANNSSSGATLTLGGNTLTVGSSAITTGTAVSFTNTGTATNANRHTLSVTLGKSGTTPTAGLLSASTVASTATGVALGSNLRILVEVDSSGAQIADGDTFAIARNNKALPATLTGITVELGESAKALGLTFNAARGTGTTAETNNTNLILTARAQPQIISGTPAKTETLNAIGESNGVKFEGASHTLIVPATNNGIGQLSGVSVATDGGTTARGIIDFEGSASVAGQVGGDLANSGRTAFTSSAPSDQLSRLTISANQTVTFRGDVGAEALNLASMGTATLEGPTGTGDLFYRMNVAPTPATSTVGTLSFANPATRPANFRGNIGASSGGFGNTNPQRIATLNIDDLASGSRTVRLLGDVYTSANGIVLNGNVLELGNDTAFSTAAPGTPYTVDALITAPGTSGGTLNIKDYDFNLLKGIGTGTGTTGRLTKVDITNATATFSENINATDVTLTPAAGQKPELVVGKNGLTIANNLTLGSDTGTHPTTLTLGANNLTVNGTLTFKPASSANPHTLALTLDSGIGKPFGQLNADSGSVVLPTDLSHLEIEVSLAAGTTRIQPAMTVILSGTALVTDPASIDNIKLGGVCSSRFRCTLTLGNNSRAQPNRHLFITAVPAQPQIVTAAADLNTNGEVNGVEFQGDHMLTVPSTKTIGNRNDAASLPVSVTTQTDNEGSIKFAGAGVVSARIGSALTTSTGGNTTFLNNPTPRVKAIGIDSANTVTFNGGIGAYTLNFSADGKAALNGPPTAGADTFHTVNVTAATGGQGTLSFANVRAANVLGNIGATGAKLKSLNIQALDGGARTVRILGDLYIDGAAGIALNGNTLELGTQSIFGTGRGTAYTVDAPITGGGALNIKDHDFNLTKALGGTGANTLSAVSIANATATFSGNINASAVTLTSARGQTSELVVGSSLSLSNTLTLGNATDGGAVLTLGANTLTVNGAVLFNPAPTTNPHKLSVTLNKDSAGARTSGLLDASRVSSTGASATTGLTLNGNLRIEVTLAEGSSEIAENDTFSIARSNTAFPDPLPSDITVKQPTGLDSNLELIVERGGTNHRDLVLKAVKRLRQVLDTDTTPLGKSVPLNDNGVANGVEFKAERTLSVADTSKNTIGNVGDIAVINSGTAAQGTIDFSVPATVSGRIGGDLANADRTAFKASPSNLLNQLNLNTASATVIFEDGVGASGLAFGANATARLNSPSTGIGVVFHRMNVTTTAASQGTLRFGNSSGFTAKFLGDIGTSSNKLNSLTLDSGPRKVDIQGHIYADGIALNSDSVLVLGGLVTSDPNTPYIIDAPITSASVVLTLPEGGTRKNFNNILSLTRASFDVKRALGTATDKLTSLTLNNASATFAAAINVTHVKVLAKSTLAAGADLSVSDGLKLCNSANCDTNESAAGGATLALGAHTLTSKGAVIFIDGTGVDTDAKRHKLSVTVSKNPAGATTSGLLDASAVPTPAIGVTLSDDLRIEVTLAEGSSEIAENDSFSIARSNTAFPDPLPSDIKVKQPAGLDATLELIVERGGTNYRDLVLKAAKRRRQVLDAGTTSLGNSVHLSAETTPLGKSVPLSADGTARGVEFRAERTLSVPADPANPKIGNLGGVSVITDPQPPQTPANPLGNLDFLAAATTVSGRIGGELTTADGAAFQASPNNLLNALNLSSTATVVGGAPAVTFEGGVGAQTLNFAEDNTARLNGPTTGSGDVFHKVVSVTTNASGGVGTLSFGNLAARPANFWGHIGAAGATGKVKSLSLEALTGGTREVRILGKIYADDIALNGNTLTLGNRTVFANVPAAADPYTVDAPITSDTDDSGILTIEGYDFDLKGLIGTSGAKLATVDLRNTTATFSEDINASAVTLTPAAGQRPELVVGKNNLALSNTLTLGNTGGDGPTTLTLGANTLTVNGALTVHPASATNPHRLAFTLGGATSGQLDAGAASVTLPTDLSHLEIDVTLAEGTGIAEFILLRSNTALVADTDTARATVENIALKCSAGFNCTLAFAARTSGRTSQPNRDLVLNVAPAQPQILTADADLDASGEANGVEFHADVTLTVPAASPAKRIGDNSVSVSVATLNDNQGTVAFAGAGTVPARIGSVLTSGTGADTAFLNNPSPRVKAIRIDSASTVTFNGVIGVRTLNLAADGTAALNGPATAGADIFHTMNVTATAADGSGASGGRGTLSFANTRAANVQGDIGTSAARLKTLTLASGSPGPVRLLGDIHAAGIALNGRALTLGNGANNVFATSDKTRSYEINAPITSNSDGSGALNLKDFTFNLKGEIGASAVKLATLNIRNATARFDETINANAVALHDGSTLGINRDLTIAGTLDLNNPSQGSTLALGASTLTLSDALSFNGTATHTLSLTLGGASHGQVSAPSVTQATGASLHIEVEVANNPSLTDGKTFTILSSSTADLPASLANATVKENNRTWDFTVSLSADNKTLRLTAKRAPVTAASVPVAADDRGDLALVPYYTVRDAWVTGIHIVNTSKRTQVVKVRLRRATDAMNALDFNLVLPPQDVYAGFLSDNENGVIAWSSSDTNCTVPEAQNNRLEMPTIYRAGAETGYVEIIAMGTPRDQNQPIALAARHGATGTPLDCEAVRSNFFANGRGTVAGVTTRNGVENHTTTWQAASSVSTIKTGGRNRYDKSGNALKVSYSIRNNATGIEFGDNAVHIRDFLSEAAITNQQYSVLSGDLNGFDFPDLNGGVPREKVGTDVNTVQRGRFDALRANNALGVESIVNEWSANRANGVQMDWVVTLPGQYVMLKLPQYFASLPAADRGWAPTVDSAGSLRPNRNCPRTPIVVTSTAPKVDECDYRDMPVALTFTAYNREQRSSAVSAEPELIISPAPPGMTPKTYLPKVTNVITFGGNPSVLGQSDRDVSADLGQPYGWLSAKVESRDSDVRVCDWNFVQDQAPNVPSTAAGMALTQDCTAVTAGRGVPVIGFAAWSRNVAANPDVSYGRIVEHSYRVSDPATTAPTTPTSP